MLGFFRKYQKYFYIVVTVVIVISFSFFGTYSTLQQPQYVEVTAFTTMDGEEVSRHDLQELTTFIGTDNEDKILLGGSWGPNFLNDGVIKNDFIDTGLAEILVQSFMDELGKDLDSRFHREKHFVPYEHPQAKFLSALNAWNVVAPDITKGLLELKEVTDPSSPKGFAVRVNLFNAERRFPHTALRYVLRYQQNQYNWISPDPNLERVDLSLFGYHTIGEWFGPRFVSLVAEFIINSAIIAEDRGYEVSKSEALADLYRNAEISFHQNANNPNLGVATVQDYFNEQLRRLGMDQTKAVNLWQKVMLFRRLFHDFGSSMLVDNFSIGEFHKYAKETIEGDLFTLPEELHLGSLDHLLKFEVYLQAVGKPTVSDKDLLSLPKAFAGTDQIAEKYPELIQRRYLLEIGKVDKSRLQAKVGVRSTWEWQVRDENWEILKKEFPELGIKPGSSEKERYQALDSLDKKTRSRVDTFARAKIVDVHPEWLDQALEESGKVKQVVGIRKKGESSIFPGLENPEKLTALLDKYPETADVLSKFSFDGKVYYHMTLLDRSEEDEVLFFSEANEEGVLDKLADKFLQSHYEVIREKDAASFQHSDGSWKPLTLVKQQITEMAMANVLEAIRQYLAKLKFPIDQSVNISQDLLASKRLLPVMQSLKDQFEEDPELQKLWVQEDVTEEVKDKLFPRVTLEEQWKIIKKPLLADRGVKAIAIDMDEAFTLQPDEWSSAYALPNGKITFAYIKKRYQAEDLPGLYEKIMQTHRLLSVDAEQALMRQLMDKMKAQKALSLEFYGKETVEETIED